MLTDTDTINTFRCQFIERLHAPTRSVNTMFFCNQLNVWSSDWLEETVQYGMPGVKMNIWGFIDSDQHRAANTKSKIQTEMIRTRLRVQSVNFIRMTSYDWTDSKSVWKCSNPYQLDHMKNRYYNNFLNLYICTFSRKSSANKY